MSRPVPRPSTYKRVLPSYEPNHELMNRRTHTVRSSISDFEYARVPAIFRPSQLPYVRIRQYQLAYSVNYRPSLTGLSSFFVQGAANRRSRIILKGTLHITHRG